MADNLVIVESPAKAKTIGRYLGKHYKIVASVGHVRDLPKSQFGVDVENDFEPKYITIRGKGDLISMLKKEAKGAKRVLLATDPDREGEAISWHLAALLNIADGDKCRITFNEITKSAVSKAVKAPRALDMDLVDAQQARRVLDRLVGYKISPILWRKVRKGLSAGRVQSVATRLICDREDEIGAFVPEEYWTATAKLSKSRHRATFLAKFYGDGGGRRALKCQSDADAVRQTVDGATYRVAAIRRSEKRKAPAAPFITSTLQQEASRKLGFPSRKTMSVVQQLYEGVDVAGHGSTGLVTYIRTDSTRISQDAQTEAGKLILERYGEQYLPKEPRQYKNKSASQDAHEAIRPSYVKMDPQSIRGSLTNDQYKLYKLIWDRFIASQMESAVYDQVVADFDANGMLFRSIGTTVKFKGFTAVYEESRDEGSGGGAADGGAPGVGGANRDGQRPAGSGGDGGDGGDAGDGADIHSSDVGSKLPELEVGEAVDFHGLETEQRFTQPPPRYTEATLIKALEEKGIGRPSTYAPTITTILARDYIEKEKKSFVPTELGKAINMIMKQHFADIVDLAFTADMERTLDNVEEGQMQWKSAIREFYSGFEGALIAAEQAIGNIEIPDEVTEVICEKCGRNMVIKMGRFGKFLACPGYPACMNAKPIVEDAGVACPRCGGKVVYRKTRKSKRYIACENSPDCEFRSWDLPANESCPVCGKFMTKSTWGGKAARTKCSDERCPSRAGEEEAAAKRAAAKDAAAKGAAAKGSAAKSATAKRAAAKGTAAKGAAAKGATAKSTAAKSTAAKSATAKGAAAKGTTAKSAAAKGAAAKGATAKGTAAKSAQADEPT